MGKLFSMPFLVDRYLADTEHLSLEEHGAYCLLLMAMWKESGSIPDDDEWISRKLRVTRLHWRKLRSHLGPFLTSYGPKGQARLTQKRLQEQWNKAIENHARASTKASTAAKIKWERERALKLIGVDAPSTAPGIKKRAPSNAPSMGRNGKYENGEILLNSHAQASERKTDQNRAGGEHGAEIEETVDTYTVAPGGERDQEAEKSHASSIAPSNPPSSAPRNAWVMPSLVRDISSPTLLVTAREEGSEEGAVEPPQPKAKPAYLKALENVERTGGRVNCRLKVK